MGIYKMHLERDLALNEASAEEKGEFTQPRGKKNGEKCCDPKVFLNPTPTSLGGEAHLNKAMKLPYL